VSETDACPRARECQLHAKLEAGVESAFELCRITDSKRSQKKLYPTLDIAAQLAREERVSLAKFLAQHGGDGDLTNMKQEYTNLQRLLAQPPRDQILYKSLAKLGQILSKATDELLKAVSCFSYAIIRSVMGTR
jgi:hypothetical protein